VENISETDVIFWL